MREQLLALKEEVSKALGSVATEQEVDQLRTRYLGRKGSLTQILRSMKDVPEEERPLLGNLANQIKQELAALLDSRRAKIRDEERQRKVREERIDISLPGRRSLRGAYHPLTLVTREIIAIFQGMGFEVVEGPEVDLDFYNFEALNFPRDHPARDMQDTFYVAEDVVLRTHTSNVQIHTMKARTPPFRVLAPGTVYRCDSDTTHSPMFHQVEGFLVDLDVNFAQLKGVLTVFCQALFAPDVALRFRPSYFPFTEPSAEVDIDCILCGGKGCPLCKYTGWLEILGSGMVHPNVLRNGGYDPDEFSGFAFGMGPERISMLKHGITDIRHFFSGDVRFLQQFS